MYVVDTCSSINSYSYNRASILPKNDCYQANDICLASHQIVENKNMKEESLGDSPSIAVARCTSSSANSTGEFH